MALTGGLHQPPPPRPKPARLAHLACHAARTTWARRPCPSLPPPRTRQRQSPGRERRAAQRQLNPSPRPGFESRVDEVERDDIAQRRMARMVICNHRLREREPFVPALCHALCTGDLDNGRAHVRASYLAKCLPKKVNTLIQPSIACSGR